MSFNQVQLIGRLGRDPEIRTTGEGKRIANLRVATSERWKDQSGQRQERTEWHTVVIFNDGLAGIAEQYLKKGAQVMLQGQLQTRKWQDQQGQDRYSTEVVLRSFSHTLVMLGGNEDRDTGGSAPQQQRTRQPAAARQPAGDPYDTGGIADDDIPF